MNKEEKYTKIDGVHFKIKNSSMWVSRQAVMDLLNGKLPKIVGGKFIIVPSVTGKMDPLLNGDEDPEPVHKIQLQEMFHTYVSGDFAAVIKEALEDDFKNKPYPLYDYHELVSAMGGKCDD